MAHQIETMAYAGMVPWHGLGRQLDSDTLTPDMLKAAGLDWSVRLVNTSGHDELGNRWGAPESFGIARFRGDAPMDADLLGTVGTKYTPIQNETLGEIGEALSKAGAVKWHTAASLFGGRKVFMLAQTEGHFEARTGDKLLPFLLIHTAHDGSASLRVKFTSVRVVCANTAAIALNAKGTEARIRHTAGAVDRIAEAGRVLGLATQSFVEQAQTARMLAEQAMSRGAAADFFAQVLTGEDDVHKALATVANAKGRSLTMYEKKGGALNFLFTHGKGNTGRTAWDALNAVTEYIDHERGRMAKWKSLDQRARGFDSGQFGDGARKKERALRLLLKRSS